jgi:hypothetical protein
MQIPGQAIVQVSPVLLTKFNKRKRRLKKSKRQFPDSERQFYTDSSSSDAD